MSKKITVIRGAWSNQYESSACFARALKKEGYDVWVASPPYPYAHEGEKMQDVDYVLPERPYPHYYSYREILDLSPWTPDVMFALDPRGAFNGEKPRDIFSCFYSTDNHRAGELHMRLIKEGQYDIVFVGQGAYLPFFEHTAPTVKLLWPAVEAGRFPIPQQEPVCDIVFVGHSGLSTAHDILLNNPLIHKNKYDGVAPSYDYAERAEFLFRLSRDFQVRIYDKIWSTPHLSLALQEGRIGFNRSILHDLALRNFEVMAAGRPLVTDDICLPPIQKSFRSIVADGICSRVYPSLYRPFYANFDVEYEYVKRIIAELLEDEEGRGLMGYRARNYALSRHTWDNRAREAMEIIRKVGNS